MKVKKETKVCGKGEIRTLGTLQYTRFPGVPVKPLLHLSVILHL